MVTISYAQTDSPKTPDSKPAERGWFYYDDPEEKEEVTPEVLELPSRESATPNKEARCKEKKTWDASCGFVDPGMDFAFQEQQREELLKNMALSKNDPKAVESFQYYIKWVMNRASEVSNLWLYNIAQNPDLDPTVSAPISAIGLKLMSETKDNSDKELYKAIQSQGGFYIYFTRHDCIHCHSNKSAVTRLSTLTGLPIYNAALDNRCIEGMEKGCMKGKDVEAPAIALKVTTVPSLFLYVPKNTWLRIATGVTDTETMRARTVSFFSAYRTALLKGINNGLNGAPSVDFSSEGSTGLTVPSGLATQGGSSTSTAMPNQAEIEKLLGKN